MQQTLILHYCLPRVAYKKYAIKFQNFLTHQILTKGQNSFTGTVNSKFQIER